MKKLLTICAAAYLPLAVLAADTDCGALITSGNIEDTAKVENLTGANAGKATVTIKNNSGTANAVTVYNSATMDTALSGKASTGDVTALQTRATNLESATNTLNTAVAGKLNKTGGIITGSLSVDNSNAGIRIYTDDENVTIYKGDGFHRSGSAYPDGYDILLPYASGILALTSDILTQFPYTAITNAPWITSYTESDPVFLAAKSGMEAATAAKVPLANVKINNTAITASTVVELGQYYVKTVDGKPHLFLRQ